jgi:hypothetical protein
MMGGSHRFLFEVIPDLFPHQYLTEVERGLWQRFYEEQKSLRKKRHA